MLELAEHAESLDKAAGLDSRDEDVPATKEALTFLFKQIMGCLADFSAQLPLNEVFDDHVDDSNTDKDLLINQYKTIIRQLKDSNRETINKQCKQANAIKEHFENLRAYVELREISRQKIEFSSVRLKAEIVKIKQQVTEYEQKTEIKSLHHSEDVHSLQQLVQRLVSGETRENVLSMSQGGSLFQNPNAPNLNLRDSSHLRETGLSASLHSLFEKPQNPHILHHSHSRTPLKQSFSRIEGMDSDVTAVGDPNDAPPPSLSSISSISSHSLPHSHFLSSPHSSSHLPLSSSSGSSSLRELHSFSRDDMIMSGEREKERMERPRRESGEFSREQMRGADSRRIIHDNNIVNNNFGPRNGLFMNDPGISHIEDESEEGDRKRQKTDRPLGVKLSQPLRSTHPRSPHDNSLLNSPPLSLHQHHNNNNVNNNHHNNHHNLPQQHTPQYHQYNPQSQHRGSSNSIKKISNPSSSSSSSSASPIIHQAKSEKNEQGTSQSATPNNGKKEPMLLAFSQGADSPTEVVPSSDVKRRLSIDDATSSSTNNPLKNSNNGPSLNSSSPISGASGNATPGNGERDREKERERERERERGERGNDIHMTDAQATIRRLSEELSMRRSSGSLDEYAFRSSNGLPGLGPVLGSNHKKRRGKLPETATSLLKRWLLEHQQHPYPTEEEKAALATTTSLTLNQINNWFTNARRRILPKQKHSGSPPSSPLSSSSTLSAPNHHGGHDEGHEYYDNGNHSHSNNNNQNNNNNNNNQSNINNLENPRHSASTPTSPTFNIHHNSSNPNNSSSSNSNNNTNTNSTNNIHTSPLYNSTGHSSSFIHGSSLPLSLSQLASNNSNPLMAQLTAQLAQRMSSTPRPSSTSPPSSSPMSSTILSFSGKKSQEIVAPTSNNSSAISPMDTDESPTTAPHTISLTLQKKDNSHSTSEIERPSSTESLPKPPLYSHQPKSQTSSLHPKPSSSHSPLSSFTTLTKDSTPTTATLTPTATLTTSSSLSTPPSSSPSTHSLPSSTTTPARTPIFPSHPLFASSPPSALSTLAQLGVSLPPQPLDPSPLAQPQQLM